ncbi:MAG: hypothetical protein JWP97_3206 [Labilithrix sp.]|nr:hypothetical protein [Labilithrix sp.]
MTRRRGAAAVAVALTALALLTALAACGGGGAKAPVGSDEGDAATAAKANAAAQTVVGHLLGAIGDHTIGPFMARTEGAHSGMVAWITGAEGTSRRVVATPVTGVGEPRGGAITIATTPVDATTLVVRPTRGGTPGFALAWTVLTDRGGEALWSVVLNEDGVPREKPVELARTTDDIVWVDVIATDAGSVAVWAEETRAGNANVLVAALDVDGKVRGAPARIVKNVIGWHALEVPGGVGISTISAVTPAAGLKPVAKAAAGPSVDTKSGALTYLKLDADGRPAAAPVVVVSRGIVSGDIEVGRTPSRLVFAWTDRTGEDPAVGAAALTDDGTVEPARRIIEGRGGATLLALAAGKAGAAVLYEAPAHKGAGDARHVYGAHLGAGPAIDGKAIAVEVMSRGNPELVATDVGFAILAPQRDCDPGSSRCLDAPILPSITRTDAALLPIQREVLGFGSDPASMAWGMSCDHELCVALAISGETPARVRAAEIRTRTNLAAPKAVPPPPGAPQVADITAVSTGDTVVDLALVHVGDEAVLASLAARPEPAPAKGRGGLEDARTATLLLTTRAIDAAGSVGPPTVITNRALQVGGVAAAPAEKPEDGAAIAWVARDNGDPEVHVTRVDRHGKKTGEVQLTTAKGDASDVAIAWAGGSWIVAWVDGRDGNGEVYATRLGLDLSRNAGERVTNAPGDASDLVALAAGDRVWLAWADPRESPRDGMADIYAAAVGSRDAKPLVAEQRLLATAAHSRTPQLALAPDAGVAVAWIEEAPLGAPPSSASGYGAMLVRLGPDGAPRDRVTKLPLAGEGAATSVALEPYSRGLHVVLARSSAEAIALDALDLGAPQPRAYPLLTLDGPPSLDVALVLDRTGLFFNDDGPASADKRARRARIAWAR